MVQKKEKYYVWCEFRQHISDTSFYFTQGWFLEKHAKLKKVVLKTTESKEPWTIHLIGDRSPASEVEAKERSYLKQREQSDI